jgi:hypothetical protein
MDHSSPDQPAAGKEIGMHDIAKRYQNGERDFREANLREANLREADLREANLSWAKGLLDPGDWIRTNFKTDDLGVIVYKRIGATKYPAASHWVIEPGAQIAEVCNPCRTCDCGCGVNFGTLEWCSSAYVAADLWRCRIAWADLASVVVPYHTDGKARCSRLELLEILDGQ